MRLFVDSSALAKRYLLEPGTPRVLRLLGEADEVVMSVITHTEVLSAFNRLRRERKMTTELYHDLRKELEADFDNGVIVEIGPILLQEAARCLEQAVLKAMDALQIASARVSGCSMFASADSGQVKAAKMLGLTARVV